MLGDWVRGGVEAGVGVNVSGGLTHRSPDTVAEANRFRNGMVSKPAAATASFTEAENGRPAAAAVSKSPE